MNTAAHLRFLGAAGTVTGSKFLLSTPDTQILVDCGMYQGDRELRRRNWAPFPAPVHELDAVVLSHAHLDHCGWLPRLVRHGFGGPVYCSELTAKVAPIVLMDAAHLQEEDAEYAARRGYSRHQPALPLFDTADAEKAIKLLRPVRFGASLEIAEEAHLRLQRAGHILGSSTVEVRIADHVTLFSGDLGRQTHPLLNPPEPPAAAQTIVVESTYGDERHQPHRAEALAEPIRRTLRRGGVVLIPAFAVDRPPVLLMTLRELMTAGEVPTVPVYVDSPMALAALEVYREAVREGGPEIRDAVKGSRWDPFDPGDLRLVHTPEESRRINQPSEPCIIISASGMATGGRVVHHLEHLAPQPRNLILLPGFQVPGTRGHALLQGATSLKMYGGYVAVHAEVKGVDDFSSHADSDDLIGWLRGAPQAPQTCYVVHGEASAAQALRQRVHEELGWCTAVPRHGERVLV